MKNRQDLIWFLIGFAAVIAAVVFVLATIPYGTRP
jgi:uncharacterized membrane protein